MKENIHLDKTIDDNMESYIEEAINLLESIDIIVNQDITFKFDKLRKNTLGQASKKDNNYFIVINSMVEREKEDYINTIIHEIIHVLTDLKGAYNGHGKEFNKYAKYIREHSKYNITRYCYEEKTGIILDNPFKDLNMFDQRKLLEEKMNNNDKELINDFKNIYFSLENEELKNKLAIFYIENYLFKQEDIVNAIRFERPSYVNNDNLRKTLCDNYLNGKYDLILNDFKKCVAFEGFFALKKEYPLVSKRTNERFNFFKK